MEEWDLKFGLQRKEVLPGEKKVHSTALATAQPPFIDYERYSDINKAIMVVARVKNILKNKTFRAGNVRL